MMPNLFVIGASKAGTTSLHDYLGLHPAIVMSTVKEPGFFLDESAREACVVPPPGSGKDPFDAYLELFPGLGEKSYAGESSPGYTWVSRFPGVAERLRNFNDAARLVYIVRDPIERTLSHYWYWSMLGSEWRRPLDAIRQNPLYCEVSNYARQFREYLRYFPRRQLYVLATEELQAHPAATMAALFGWLGLPSPPGHSDALYSRHMNRTPAAIRQPRGVALRIRESPLFGRLRGFIPPTVRKCAWEFIKDRRVVRAHTDVAEATDYLQRLQRPQIREFED